MKWSRIISLGFGIGVFLNLVGILGNGVLLRQAWADAIPVRPAQAMTGAMSTAVSLSSDFVFGLALVWLYAAMLPRFGATFATGARAALVIWILGVAVPYVGIVRIGWLPAGITVATALVALVGFVPAVWLTVRFYPATSSAEAG